MEYTEEVKTEADEVAMKYLKYCHYSTDRASTTKEEALKLRRNYSVEAAIQDRQSVLDYAIKKLQDEERSYDRYEFKQDIKSLTQQIDYLKSKI